LPLPLPARPALPDGRRPIAMATTDGVRTAETAGVRTDVTPLPETWPRAQGAGTVVSRPTNTWFARVEGEAVAADDVGSPPDREARSPSMAMPQAPVPSPPGVVTDGRSAPASVPGPPQHMPSPPPALWTQVPHDPVASASSELTFTFHSWGHGQAVTATLARSGYVYLNPSSARVSEALMASKPEERWLVERTAATGEDDNHGKQRRKRQ
jgi:hypothetical protein